MGKRIRQDLVIDAFPDMSTENIRLNKAEKIAIIKGIAEVIDIKLITPQIIGRYLEALAFLKRLNNHIGNLGSIIGHMHLQCIFYSVQEVNQDSSIENIEDFKARIYYKIHAYSVISKLLNPYKLAIIPHTRITQQILAELSYYDLSGEEFVAKATELIENALVNYSTTLETIANLNNMTTES